jgi:hypothetical protein
LIITDRHRTVNVLTSDADPLLNTVWYKVIDNNGSASDVKTFTVSISRPIIEAPASMVVRWDQEAMLNVAAAVKDGAIKKYIWKISTDLKWDTTIVPTWKVRHPEGGSVDVTIGAIDNYGNTGFTHTIILFNRRPETISLEYPINGRRHIFDEIDFSDTMGKILAYGLSATDPDGADDSLRFSYEITDSLSKKTRRINNVKNSFWIDSLLPDRCYLLTYKAFDRFGDSVENQISVLSQNFFPKGMVFFPRDQEHGINHPFWIDTTEVTQEEWALINDIVPVSNNLRLPQIISNTLYAEDHCTNLNKKLNLLQGTGFRIPTQTEWIRAYINPDSQSTYYWGSATHQDIVKKYAWYDLNAQAAKWTIPHAAQEGVQPVAQLLPNEYGLYDMSGNVAEFVRSNKQYVAYLSIGGDAYSSVDSLTPVPNDFFTIAGFRKVFGKIDR